MSDRRLTDDLFDKSTMTFGSHLEELRVALFKALSGLVVGCLVGLAIASHVVTWIETPLRKALETYYVEKDIEDLKSTGDEELNEDIEEFIRSNGLVVDEILIEHAEAERFGKELKLPAKPLEQLANQVLPQATTSFVKLRVWRQVETRITALNAQEAFMIWLKAAFVTGFVISSPWMFWQIWSFVAAGLYVHERRYVYLYLPFSLILFLSGASMAFFFVFEPVLDFLFTFNRKMNIDPDPRISEWVGFVLFLPIGFGIAFQLPLVMLFINRIGVLTTEAFINKWRIAVLAIFVLSMLLTPADPVSMLLLALPLTLLYALGIALCKWMPANRSPMEDKDIYEP